MRSIVEGRFLTLVGVAATILLLLNLAYLNSHGTGVEDCGLLETLRQEVVEDDTHLQLPLLSTEPKESFRGTLILSSLWWKGLIAMGRKPQK